MKSAAKAVFDGVMTLVNDFVSTVNQTFSIIWGTFQDIGRTVVSLTETATDLAVHVIPDAINGALDTVSQWVHDAVDAAARFVNDAVSFLQPLIDAVSNSLDFVWHQILDPVVQWVEHAYDTVSGWIAAAADAFYHDVIVPILDSVRSIFDELAKVADYLWNRAYTVIEFLWHLAEVIGLDLLHPERFIEQMADAVRGNLLAREAEDVAHVVTEGAGDVVETVTRWLGA